MRRWWDVLPIEKVGELYHEVQCVEVATPTALTCKNTFSIDFLTELGRTRLIDTGRRSSKRVLVPQPSDDPHDSLVSSPLYEQDRHDLLVEAIELKRYRNGIPSGIFYHDLRSKCDLCSGHASAFSYIYDQLLLMNSIVHPHPSTAFRTKISKKTRRIVSVPMGPWNTP